MPLTIVGACVVPLIYFFNSYFLGKIIKKIFPQYNIQTSIGLGFFIFLTIIFIVSLPIFVSPISFLGYGIILLIAQFFLLFLYIFNWKYSFSIELISKKELIFTIFIFLAIFGSWFLSNNIHQAFSLSTPTIFQNYFSYQNALNDYFIKEVTWNSSVFTSNVDSNIIQYCSWNSLNKLWIFLFQIPTTTIFNPYDSYFGNYALLSIYSIITSLIISGCFSKEIETNNYFKITIIFATIISLNSCLFMFLTNSINGISWLIPISILMLSTSFNSIKNLDYKLDFLYTLLIIASYSMTQIFIVLLVGITIVKFLSTIIAKRPSYLSSFMICSLGITLITSFVLQNISIIASLVILVTSIIIYILWFIFIRFYKFKNYVKKIELFLSNHIWTFIIFFILIIYFSSLFLAFNGGIFTFNINSWIIFENKFTSSNLNDLSNTHMLMQKVIQIAINISFWIINIIVFSYCFYVIVIKNLICFQKLIKHLSKNRHIFWNRIYRLQNNVINNNSDIICIKTKLTDSIIGHRKYINDVDINKNYYILLATLLFLIVWNPLSTNIIDNINWGFNVDVSWLFFLIVINVMFNNLSIKNTNIKIIFASCVLFISVEITTLISVYNFT